MQCFKGNDFIVNIGAHKWKPIVLSPKRGSCPNPKTTKVGYFILREMKSINDGSVDSTSRLRTSREEGGYLDIRNKRYAVQGCG